MLNLSPAFCPQQASPPTSDPVSVVEDAGEDCDDPSGSGKGDRDKEWAALTTWLRMNLHQPRTQKRVVLFTGSYIEHARRWEFILNPELTWDDVSPETRVRLRTLPDETVRCLCWGIITSPTEHFLTNLERPLAFPSRHC